MSTAKMYSKMFKSYPDALNTKHVQEMLGIGKNLAYRLINEGKIPSVRMGRKIVIAKSHVIEYLIKS